MQSKANGSIPGFGSPVSHCVSFHRRQTAPASPRPNGRRQFTQTARRWEAAPALAGGREHALICLLPIRALASPPSHHGEIEDSFIQFLHTAFLERLQFGRDFVFNFGPWGFLYGGYHPATHLISVIAWLGFALVFWWTGWRVARHFSRNTLAAWLWLMAFAAVAGLPDLHPD